MCKSSIIYCEAYPEKDIDKFFLKYGSETIWLFNQRHKDTVAEYYGSGVTLDRAIGSKNRHRQRNPALNRVMDKIPSYIRYIEKEYDIQVLEKTKERKGERRWEH